MNKLITFLFVITLNLGASEIYKFRFARTGGLCAGIDPQMQVIDGTAYVNILKECLFGADGKRTRLKTHKDLKVIDGSVFFKGKECGVISNDGFVDLPFHVDNEAGESINCYFYSTNNYTGNSFYLKARI